MGLVVLDLNQRIEVCFGKLTSWLSPGAKATEVIPFLVGLDDTLDEIAEGRLPSLSLPRISWHGPEIGRKVLSLEIIPSGEPGLLHIVFRDETEIATLEQKVVQQRNELALTHRALRQAKENAERALQEKAAFLANISHDLKTPLQVIMGNAEILRGDLPEGERDGFLRDISDNSTFLLALITDLLEASSLEAAQLELTEEPIDVRELLERILSMARQMPGGDKRCFELKTADVPSRVMADPMRLQRLLLNIVSNAVKFTGENGHVAAGVWQSDSGDLMVEVKDDGCGIEPELMDRVFEPFTRSGHSEGTGLGLHIAQGLAALHDAKLSLTSQQGTGTTVTLCLPKSRLIASPT